MVSVFFADTVSANARQTSSLTSLRLRVVSRTKERIYYHLPEKKKGEERGGKEDGGGKRRKKKGGERRKEEKREKRKECPIESNRMPPEVLRNPIDEIYGYTCKKKIRTPSLHRNTSRRLMLSVYFLHTIPSGSSKWTGKQNPVCLG